VISHELATALEIRREAPDELTVEAFLRLVGRPNTRLAASPGAIAWVVSAASALSNYVGYAYQGLRPIDITSVVTSVGETAVQGLRRWDAVSALGIVAPSTRLPAGTPAEVERAARAIVRQHLPDLCRKAMEAWAREGQLSDPCRDRPPDL
jgi:hypothetical protein